MRVAVLVETRGHDGSRGFALPHNIRVALQLSLIVLLIDILAWLVSIGVAAHGS
jgi:hypothetical protein